MPFFGNFGSKKKSKSSLTLTDGGSDPGWAGVQQGGSSGFNSNTWQSSSAGMENQDKRMITKLERINNDLEDKNEQLEEENNMLKLKVEILLDMLAQKTAESSFQDNEIDRLKSVMDMMASDSLTLI